MRSVILTALVVLLTLSAIAYLTERGKDEDERNSKVLSLLPGDISWQNESGNVRVYFPITTSIVLSVVLSLVMWLFR